MTSRKKYFNYPTKDVTRTAISIACHNLIASVNKEVFNCYSSEVPPGSIIMLDSLISKSTANPNPYD